MDYDESIEVLEDLYRWCEVRTHLHWQNREIVQMNEHRMEGLQFAMDALKVQKDL